MEKIFEYERRYSFLPLYTENIVRYPNNKLSIRTCTDTCAAVEIATTTGIPKQNQCIFFLMKGA